jgi:hypothetical protein
MINEKQNKFITREAKKTADGNVSQFVRNLIDEAQLAAKADRKTSKNNANANVKATANKKKAPKATSKVKTRKMVPKKKSAK